MTWWHVRCENYYGSKSILCILKKNLGKTAPNNVICTHFVMDIISGSTILTPPQVMIARFEVIEESYYNSV